MPITRATDAGISQRTNVYAAKEMLKHAMPVMVLDKVAKPIRMPRNRSDTIKFRRPIPFDAATTPLAEGITPNATQMRFEDVETALKQYGEFVEITDVIEDLVEDPVLKEAAEQCGENMGRTLEAVNYGAVRGGTNAFYANGGQRSAVNTALSLALQRKITRSLKAQKAKKISKILDGSPNYATTPIEASYVGIGHTNLEADIRDMPGFVPTAKYGTRSIISPHEIGTVEDVRYVLSPDLEPFEDAGGAPGGNVVSTGGTKADVYPVMFFGQDAWGTVALRGSDAIDPYIVPVNKATKDDPLAQRGTVGWKTYHAALILNQAWMVRAEVAVSEL
ncbi:MAG: N4-gp56 family major capsid protein [Pseudomonadota bacterium]